MKIGNRITVIKSLYGMYDGKKGTIVEILDEVNVVVILDINKGRIDEKTILPISCIELDSGIEEHSVNVQVVTSKTREDNVSIDDRIDTLEEVLHKYNLSIKDGCGFMYIYDFLEQLSNKWEEITKDDKDNVIFCLIGENKK